MAKKIILDIEVNSKSVVDATKNVDGLNTAVKDTETTTKEFGTKVKIEYDKAGKATDVLIDKELTLKKQIRTVYDQMQLLTAAGKGQSQEFTILQRKYNDLNDNLAKNKARSQELFGTLSMLPGPVGAFAQQMQGALDLLKTFSGYKLSDITNQVTALGADLKDIVKGFLGIGAAKAAASAGGEVAGATGAGVAGTAVAAGVGAGAAGAGVAASTGAIAANTAAIVANTAATNGLVISEELASLTGKELAITMETIALAVGATDATMSKNIVTLTLMNGELVQLTKNEMLAIGTTIGLGEAEVATAAASGTLATAWATLMSVLTAGAWLLLAAAVAAVGAVIYKILPWLLNYTRETDENTAATDAFTEALKREQQALNDDLNTIDVWLKIKQTRAKILGASDKEAAEMAIQAGKEKLEALITQDKLLLKEQTELSKRKDLTNEQSAKLNTDINKRLIDSNRAVLKQIMDNEQTALDAQLMAREKSLSIQQKYYTNYLAELDAKIQLEIDKDQTGGEKLQKLIDERNKKVIEHDKLFGKAAEAQRELMRKNGLKKTQDALDEDTKRVQAYQSRIGDIEIAAIKDNQQRDESARKKKLNDDINNIKLDTEFRNKGIVEQQMILKELELAYQNDLVKIRETYFLKKFQKYDEEKTREIKEKALHIENLLGQDEKYLIDGQLGFFSKSLLHTKEYLKNKFIDMNLAAQVEHDNTELKLQNELDILKAAYDKKKLTDDEYANQKNVVNQKIADNDQQLIEKQIELDKRLLDAKKATAKATMDIADNLVNVLSALGEFSTDFQITAALADAGLGIAKIIISTQVAIAEFSASVAALGPVGAAMAAAYAIKAKIAAGLGIAAITIGAIGKINSIKKQAGAGGGASSGASSSPTEIGSKPNYGDGGMIDGPRHAEGGVAINAEGGEAVMTRGAVTMFKPLLSMLNQVGGGTSFTKGASGQASYDNPKDSNLITEQQIIKTYVVEQDLTSVQHRNARLKDLSTL